MVWRPWYLRADGRGVRCGLWDVSGDVKNSLDQPQLTLLNVFHASLVRTVIINTAAVSVLLSVLEPIFLQPFLAQVRLSLGGSWGAAAAALAGPGEGAVSGVATSVAAESSRLRDG